MTLPKPISDAIDNFESKAVDHWMHDHYGTDRATFDAKRRLVTDARAALEAAILAHIQPAPVEPPTDAEVEAWAEQFKDHCQPEGFAEDGKWVRSDSDQAHSRYERVLDSGLALMRRARSTDALAKPWNGGPTITALMQGVEDAATEWGKCVGDYHAACQASPPPSDPMALEPVRKAGHRCELAHGAFRKAIQALANHGTPTDALAKLRERVQKVQAEVEANANNFDTMATAGYGLQVLRWIDEAQQEAKR